MCITQYARLYNLSNGIVVMTLTKIGFFPFNRGMMLPRLVKIQYKELELSCETFLLSKMLFIVTATLTFDLMTREKIGFFPFHRVIMWPRLVNIQYTELKLSCGNDHIFKNNIYSNLDLRPNDPKINRILSLPQGNHVDKFGKDPIYRTNVIVRKGSCCQQFYL
jgi:hypothetical protein